MSREFRADEVRAGDRLKLRESAADVASSRAGTNALSSRLKLRESAADVATEVPISGLSDYRLKLRESAADVADGGREAPMT